ncbi:iq-domain [Orobanche gracilis]
MAKGYICRKQFTKYLHQMHAIARAQARARAGRVLNSEASISSTKSSSNNFNHNRPNGNVIYKPENSHSIRNRWMSRRTSDTSWDQGSFSFTRIVPLIDDERRVKILEVDTGEPHIITSKYRKISQYCQTFSTPNPPSGEVQSSNPLKFTRDVQESSNYFCTANNSRQYYSASSLGRPPLTLTDSDDLKSYASVGYVDFPNYMAYTESSKAKVRSVSAPKQRPQYERSSSSANKYSVHPFGNSDSRLNKALHASFTSKAYPGLGRLDKLEMPVRDVSGFSGGLWHRY